MADPDAPADLSAPHRIILVRHGRTSHTEFDRISGAGFRPEPELSAAGLTEAQTAVRRLQALGETIDVVVASPLLRARQTADVITAWLGLPNAEVEEYWAEADFGDWEGLTVAQVQERFPGSWERLVDDPAGRSHGGESLNDVRRRVLRAWEGLSRPGHTTLVVTHLTPIRIVVAEVLGIPDEALLRVMAAPGSITVVDRWRDGGAVLRAVGERPA